MALVFAAAYLLLFGGYGVVHVGRESRDLRAAIEREVALLGRAIQVSVDAALRDRQLGDVQSTLAVLEAVDSTVDIVVTDPSGRVQALSEGAPASEPTRDAMVEQVLETGRTARAFRFEDELPRMLAGYPVTAPDGALLGAVVVVRPLDDMRDDLRRTRTQILVVVVLGALAATALSLLIGNLYLRRPLGRIARAMQRARSDLGAARLEVERDDEVGAVAREFNVLMDDLIEARERLLQEAEARVRLERGLRKVDKMATIGQLAAGLAHEIGSPLQVLGGRARALAARPADPDRTRRNAEIIAEQSERISRVVEHLLQFGRRSSPALSRFDLVEVIERVADFMAHESQRRGVTIDIETTLPQLEVEADRDQLQQVAVNLLQNALAATPPGGWIRIGLHADAFVAPGPNREVPGVRLEFADGGRGIEAELLPSLFEPFFTTRASEGGTGLGLAVVKSIVTEHGGTVSLESELGRGTRVIVHLPLGPSRG